MMMMRVRTFPRLALVTALTVFFTQASFAGHRGSSGHAPPPPVQEPSQPTDRPDCMSKNNVLPIDNAQVLAWKTSTANQYLTRGHIQGKLVSAYPDRNGHHHWKVQIGPEATDTVEVVYQIQFGPTPDVHPGQSIEACGDYITSTAPGGGYDASPDGALIHWVHCNPSGHGHDSGYIAIDNNAYGTCSH